MSPGHANGGRLWRVVLHDDQEHSYQYVVQMLVDLLNMTQERAYGHAVEVDKTGRTAVACLPRAAAAELIERATQYGGDPWMKTEVSMKFSLEPLEP